MKMKGIGLAVLSLGLTWVASAADGTEDYTELDYVEATGNQWVDTGLVGRFGMKAEIKVEWVDVSADTTMLASRADGSTDSRINFANTSGGRIGLGYGFYDDAATYDYNGRFRNYLWETERIYTVETDFSKLPDTDDYQMKMTIDNRVTAYNRQTNLVVDTGVNLVVFGNNIAGSVRGYARARCYGLKIWRDGELVRDYRPVLKDGRAALYDAVAKTFNYSATGTDLVAGTKVNEPDGFVDYVESQGNDFIDLEVVAQSGISLESRMAWTELPDDASFVGARSGDTRFYLVHYSGPSKFSMGYGNFISGSVYA